MPAGEAARVSAVILAAGRSRRAGAPKLALPFRGGTVLGCLLRALSRPGVAERVVVLGHHREALEPIVREAAGAGPRVVTVVNPDPEGDMASSVRIGVGACAAGSQWILVSPGDLPALRPQSVDLLLAEVGRCGSLKHPPVLVPACGGRAGHPVAIPKRLRADVVASAPGWTLRELVYGSAYPVREVPVNDEGIFRDIDRPADREALEP